MCEALRILMEEEREQGMEKGIEQGILMTLCELLKRGKITLEDAVSQAGMTEAVFREKMKTYFSG